MPLVSYIGYVVPFGCEAAVHAAHCYLQSLDPNHLTLKFDFRNAFNTLRRDKDVRGSEGIGSKVFHTCQLSL